MDIKRVAPERTDTLTRASEIPVMKKEAARKKNIDSVNVNKIEKPHSGSGVMLVGKVPKSVAGFASLIVFFIIAMIFGVRELDMSIPVYIIVLAICAAIGFLLSNAPGFVSIFISALLLIVGAIVGLLPAVALGTALLTGTSLILRGE
ncbi:MAG: hypothetical protein K6G03_00885 [Lachnospiraceae bacterium]|nr:hypothetical protein [Lachnospiraceae bacterium]